jgi:hypothetical protein
MNIMVLDSFPLQGLIARRLLQFQWDEMNRFIFYNLPLQSRIVMVP